MYFSLEILALAFLGFITFSNCQKAAKLPTFNVYDKRISLSGFSSGGTFSQQFQFVFSSQIHGVAVFSHAYYRCGPANGLVDDYDKVCTKLANATEFEIYNTDLVHKDIQDYQSKRLIENASNLLNKRLYVFTGLRNIFFTPAQSLNILKVYERYIKNPGRIMTRVMDAQLLMPTNSDFGASCTQPANDKAFIGNCGFSGAYEALKFIHQSDHDMNREPQAATGKNKQTLFSQLKTFDQTEFLKDLKLHFMDTEGFYFVPKKCEKQKCLIHFFFHGCLTGREFVGRRFVENSGYLEVGDSNGIIMVFPQALKSLPNNDIGCWDTFGIGGRLYATNVGPQIVAVKRMLDRAIGKSSSQSSKENSGWQSQYSQSGTKSGQKQNQRHRHSHSLPGWGNAWAF